MARQTLKGLPRHFYLWWAYKEETVKTQKAVLVRVTPDEHKALRIIAAEREDSVQKLMQREIQRFIAKHYNGRERGDE